VRAKPRSEGRRQGGGASGISGTLRPLRILAISDLHLSYPSNRKALAELEEHPDDWLLLAGDTGEKVGHLESALDALCPRFAKVFWAPGNHELWTPWGRGGRLRGEARYRRLVEVCRSRRVRTPEDPYDAVELGGQVLVVAPLFLLFDYSFRPDEVPLEDVIAWAAEGNIVSADEQYLDPWPYPSRGAWCEARCRDAEERLSKVPRAHRLVLLNHFPLRQDLVRLRQIPRFSPWCGTRRTEDWHRRFNVAAVVTGHLHLRSTDWRDGVRFEEVSLGYPEHWDRQKGIEGYLREIWPGPPEGSQTVWHR